MGSGVGFLEDTFFPFLGWWLIVYDLERPATCGALDPEPLTAATGDGSRFGMPAAELGPVGDRGKPARRIPAGEDVVERLLGRRRLPVRFPARKDARDAPIDQDLDFGDQDPRRRAMASKAAIDAVAVKPSESGMAVRAR